MIDYVYLIALTLAATVRGSSLIAGVEDHLKNGGSCSSYIENYSRTIASGPSASLKIYDEAVLNAARIDVDKRRSTDVNGNSYLNCVPLIIRRESDNFNNNYTIGKSISIINYFKRLGAVPIAEYDIMENGSSPTTDLPKDYPQIILHAGITDKTDLRYLDRLTSIFADSTQQTIVPDFGRGITVRRKNGGNGNDKCILQKVTLVFRINSLRENVAVTTNNLEDAILMCNATVPSSADNGNDRRLSSIRRKKIGLLDRRWSENSIGSRVLAAKVTNLLLTNGALLKNVSFDSEELTSLLYQLDNLTDCSEAGNSKRRENRAVNADLLCWTAIKKRYRLRSKFVKRVVEPLFGNNDLLIAWRTDDSTIDHDEFDRFFQLLVSVDYPTAQLTWKCAKSGTEHVRISSRPNRMDGIFNVAQMVDTWFNAESRSSGSARPVNLFHRDFCGQIVLSGISDGPTLFAYELCSPNGLCVNAHDGFRCECVPGYGGRFCNKVVSPFTIIQKCVLYPTYQTVMNNLTGACPDQTTCVPYAHHCLFNYCDNPHGWCLPVEELRKDDNIGAS